MFKQQFIRFGRRVGKKKLKELLRGSTEFLISYLKAAVDCNKTQVINDLLRFGYRIDVIDEWGRTLLHLAFLSKNRKGNEFSSILKVDSIFFKFKEDKNYIDKNGLSHLHIACAIGLLDVVKHFVEKGVDVNARCKSVEGERYEDYAALHFAVRFKREDVIMYLLQHGSDMGSISNPSLTPLHVAYEDHSLSMGIPFDDCGMEIMKILLDHGSPIDAQDERGHTPLMWLFVDRQCHVFQDYYIFRDKNLTNKEMLRENSRRVKEKFEFLLRSGADVNMTTKSGCTVLNYAVKNLWIAHKPSFLIDVHFDDDDVIIDMIQILLDRGVDVNAADDTGRTALETAVSGLSVGAVEVLLNRGADVNAVKFDRTCVENDGNFFVSYVNTPPCLRAVENLLDILELLLAYGWNMKSQECLPIMTFLIWSAKKFDLLDDNAIKYDWLPRCLTHSSPLAVREICEKNFNSKCVIKNYLRRTCRTHLVVMNITDFHISEEVKQLFKFTKTSKSYQGLIQRIKSEIELIKKIIMSENVTLYDVMTMNPHQIYRHLRNKEYRMILRDENFDETIYHLADTIRGHFAKCLIRKCICELARIYLKPAIFPRLPDLCITLILNDLSNGDLLNLCLAVFSHENYVSVDSDIKNVEIVSGSDTDDEYRDEESMYWLLGEDSEEDDD